MLVEQQRRFIRRGWALERHAEDGEEHVTAVERLEPLAQALSAGNRVELESALDETWRRCVVIVRTKCDDEDVRVVRARVGDDTPCGRVDRRDVFSPKLHPGHRDGVV